MLGFINKTGKEVPPFLNDGRTLVRRDRGYSRMFAIDCEEASNLEYPGDEKTFSYSSENYEFWDITGKYELDLHTKDNLLRGDNLVLGDGQTYTIPKLRRCLDGQLQQALPTYITLNKKGDYIQELQAHHKKLSEYSIDVFTRYCTGGLAIPEAMDFITQVMSLNYYITVPEITAYRLISESDVDTVLISIFDLEVYRQWKLASDEQKKTS